MQKSIAVLATGKKSSQVMAEQIRQVFSNDAITVTPYWLDELRHNPRPPIVADLALLSCNAVKEVLSPFIHPTVPLLIANRTLRLDVIDQLLELPIGCKTLLVTKTTVGATEALETLGEIGFSQLSVHSLLIDDYAICASITTVLLFDEPEQIPKWATKVIDLGVREIELSSLVALAHKLNEPLKTNIPISIQYLQEIVHRSQRMLKSAKTVELLNRQLSVVLNNVTDCLIVVDADFIIRFLNDTAQAFLGLQSREAVGQSLQQLIPELQEIVSLEYDCSPEKRVVTLAERTYHVDLQTLNDVEGQQISAIITLRNVTEVLRMENEVRQALRKRGYVSQYTFANIVGNSSTIQEAVGVATKLSASDLNVMIHGENGTGKELFAHSIHSASPRASGPFIAVNCAALSPTLLESELFGYEDGAFTGAKKGGKSGLIEQADKGTLFLDEIGDITLEAQTKLLRVIQERALMRIGGGRIIPVNIRIIAATNKDLQDMVAKGQFRQDLFYRLFVAPLYIPPLRDHSEDIPAMLESFMQEYHIAGSYIDNELLECLRSYSWPGNIRELSNIVQYAGVISDSSSSFKKAIFNRIHSWRENSTRFPIDLQPEDLPLYISILNVFAEAGQKNLRIGRQSLCNHLRLQHPAITEQSLRSRIAKLANAGFLESGVGRQGTQITNSGELFRSQYTKA
ncbi:MAG TPA: sigma 54-interacting transcriptional regulator [Negativicutes bacterium]|nr:sigma 54-interacting transcriptional regulator [Negativicutes bacterium]